MTTLRTKSLAVVVAAGTLPTVHVPVQATPSLAGPVDGSTAAADDTPAFEQAPVVLALPRPGGGPLAATDFLFGTRCDSGGFPSFLPTPPATCGGSVDATAVVAKALRHCGHPDAGGAVVTRLAPTPPPAEPDQLAVTGSSVSPLALTGAALMLGGVTVLIGLRVRRRGTAG